jgi:hypothetical protein
MVDICGCQHVLICWEWEATNYEKEVSYDNFILPYDLLKHRKLAFKYNMGFPYFSWQTLGEIPKELLACHSTSH